MNWKLVKIAECPAHYKYFQPGVRGIFLDVYCILVHVLDVLSCLGGEQSLLDIVHEDLNCVKLQVKQQYNTTSIPSKYNNQPPRVGRKENNFPRDCEHSMSRPRRRSGRLEGLGFLMMGSASLYYGEWQTFSLAKQSLTSYIV
jgi:hypothetical protein